MKKKKEKKKIKKKKKLYINMTDILHNNNVNIKFKQNDYKYQKNRKTDLAFIEEINFK